MIALFKIDDWDYVAVIPHIQNLYSPEETPSGWQYGFKYTSGIFEYFQCKTKEEADIKFSELESAVEIFYTKK